MKVDFSRVRWYRPTLEEIAALADEDLWLRSWRFVDFRAHDPALVMFSEVGKTIDDYRRLMKQDAVRRGSSLRTRL